MTTTERQEIWTSTMSGHAIDGYRYAHQGIPAKLGTPALIDREAREHLESLQLCAGATRAAGAGARAIEEEPDLFRTCFEVDRDRILHRSSAFRRLAGKTQVFIFPEDHVRTRLTHALEVAQVARAIAAGLGLNVALTEAIALAHDCGHGPFGHASEDALSQYLAEGYNHATWGADVVLQPLNLTKETLDGVRNHSWSRPSPATAEGEVVSLADRIAYVCHDFEDACSVGIVDPSMLPLELFRRTQGHRGRQLDLFITDVILASHGAGSIAMSLEVSTLLGEFRQSNYDLIYNRAESVAQAEIVKKLLVSLMDYYIEHPSLLEPQQSTTLVDTDGTSLPLLERAVTYVAGMTDRYVVRQAISLLNWNPRRLPLGIDLGQRY